jgi:hypothetical protein
LSNNDLIRSCWSTRNSTTSVGDVTVTLAIVCLLDHSGIIGAELGCSCVIGVLPEAGLPQTCSAVPVRETISQVLARGIRLKQMVNGQQMVQTRVK